MQTADFTSKLSPATKGMLTKASKMQAGPDRYRTAKKVLQREMPAEQAKHIARRSFHTV